MARSLSVIIPTYQEADNLELLMQRISDALASVDFQWNVIIVDDNSQDETVNICDTLTLKYPLELIVRTHERGLASAVVDGMKSATGDIVLCMDADLSHPPEAIPEIHKKLSQDSCDFVIGSRYISGGSTDDAWGLFRWLNSVVATGLAKPLTSAKDPMAGFFALKRTDFESAVQNLDPIGYKIGLELIVKCHCKNVDEVPIHFSDRQFGESKLSFKEQLNYLRHLKKLYTYKWPEFTRFLRFGLVGCSGVIVNLTALSMLLSTGLNTPVSIAAAIWVAMTWNFFLNRKFTFQDFVVGKLAHKYLQFCLASLTGAVVNWSVATYLWTSIPFFAGSPTTAGFVGIMAGMILNFTLCSRFVFRNKKSTPSTTQAVGGASEKNTAKAA
ncbi:glycosyltransferase family 2 protein [bacterium]|nr:glycosyltransferase family 2 protein [bacterium]